MKEKLRTKLVSWSITKKPSLGAPAPLKWFSEHSNELFNRAGACAGALVMTWMTIAWPMVTAACLTLALIYLGIACGQTQRAPHFFFFLNALAVAAIAGLELAVLQADDLGRYQTLLCWVQLPPPFLGMFESRYRFPRLVSGSKAFRGAPVQRTCIR
jgi:hypothetical protein